MTIHKRSEFERACSAIEDLTNTVHDRLDDIEKRINRPGALSVADGLPQKSDAYRAFEKLLRYGPDQLTTDERQAAVISGDDTRGGYLSPPEFVSDVIRNLVQFSPIRALARVGKTSAGQVLLPKRNATGTAVWVNETEQRSEAQPTYGQESIPINEAACYVDVSLQQLEDAAVDMASELALGFAEEFGRLEGYASLLGVGNKQPEGVLNNTSVSAVPSLHASTITADGLISALYSLPPYYRNKSTWVMNGSTLAAIRKLKGGDGNYLLQPGLALDRPDTLLSRPIVEAVDAPSIAAQATPIILGSWGDAYRIYDRVHLSVLWDNFTQAQTGKVRFWARRRVGMGVVQAEALKKVIISAS